MEEKDGKRTSLSGFGLLVGMGINWNTPISGRGRSPSIRVLACGILITAMLLLNVVMASQIGSAADSDGPIVRGNRAPLASFQYTPYQIRTGSPVAFVDTSMDDGQITSWYWDFGDGTSSNSINPSKTYTQVGHYTTTLTVGDNAAAQSSYSITYNVQDMYSMNAEPSASFMCKRADGLEYSCMGAGLQIHTSETIQFIDHSLDFYGDTIKSWFWNFGDGTPSSGEQNPSHKYVSPGMYRIALVATDVLGGSGAAFGGLDVRTPPGDNHAPVAKGSPDQVEVKVGEEACFWAEYSFDEDYDILSFFWDFGDGYTTDGEPDPVLLNKACHAYSTVGTYTVTLNVSDGQLSSTDQMIAKVNPDTPPQDTTPPIVLITSLTNGQTLSLSPIAVSGTASDPGSPSSGLNRVDCRVNSGNWFAAIGTSSWSCTVNLLSGLNIIDANSWDNAGNPSLLNSVIVTYSPPPQQDVTPPTVYIASPSDGQSFSSSMITVSGTASDPGSPSSGLYRIDVRVNGGSWSVAGYTSPWSYTVGLASGSNKIEAKSLDNVGNPSTVASVTVIYNPPPQQDNTRPTVSITSPTSGQTFSSSPITISGTADDPGIPSSGLDRVDVRVNSGSWTTATGKSSWSCTVNLISGSNVIEAKSWDNADNPSYIGAVTVTYSPPPPPTEPRLDISTRVLDFGSASIGFSGDTSFEIRNSGSGTLTYTLTWASPWIVSVNPDSGTISKKASISVHVDLGSYGIGEYEGEIQIDSNGGSDTVLVKVKISNPAPHGIYQIDLVVSIRGDVGSSFFDPFETGLRNAANALWDATEGQFWIRSVSLFDNMRNWDGADIQVFDSFFTPYCDGRPCSIGVCGKGGHIYLALGWNGDFTDDPQSWTQRNGYIAIVHELGHYVLWSSDEYLHPDGTHILDSQLMHTLMADPYDYTEFSVRSDYESPQSGVDTNTQQWATGESSWEEIKDRYPDVTIPESPAPGPFDDVGADTIITIYDTVPAGFPNSDTGDASTSNSVPVTMSAVMIPVMIFLLGTVGVVILVRRRRFRQKDEVIESTIRP